MIENLQSYFLPDHDFYLENITYNKLDEANPSMTYSLNVMDTVKAEIDNNLLNISIKREIQFDPKSIFEIIVVFGATLTFNPEKQGEINWDEINIADEFTNNGDFVLNNLVSRTSLLISQITSSYGLHPLVTPPLIAGKIPEP